MAATEAAILTTYAALGRGGLAGARTYPDSATAESVTRSALDRLRRVSAYLYRSGMTNVESGTELLAIQYCLWWLPDSAWLQLLGDHPEGPPTESELRESVYPFPDESDARLVALTIELELGTPFVGVPEDEIPDPSLLDSFADSAGDLLDTLDTVAIGSGATIALVALAFLVGGLLR